MGAVPSRFPVTALQPLGPSTRWLRVPSSRHTVMAPEVTETMVWQGHHSNVPRTACLKQ